MSERDAELTAILMKDLPWILKIRSRLRPLRTSLRARVALGIALPLLLALSSLSLAHYWREYQLLEDQVRLTALQLGDMMLGSLRHAMLASDREMLAGLEHGEAAITRKTAARLIEGVADLSRPRSEPLDSLTRREIEILRLVAEGLSNKAIAQALFVSENTVKYHIRNILQKLGVQNRTEAATCALRAGLLKSDPLH